MRRPDDVGAGGRVGADRLASGIRPTSDAGFPDGWPAPAQLVASLLCFATFVTEGCRQAGYSHPQPWCRLLRKAEAFLATEWPHRLSVS